MNRFASYLRDVFTVTCEPAVVEAAKARGQDGAPAGRSAPHRRPRNQAARRWLRADARVDAVSNTSGGNHEVGSEAGRVGTRRCSFSASSPNTRPRCSTCTSRPSSTPWAPLRDSRLFARQAAVRALRARLVVIERRETRYRVQWYYRLYEETQNGLKRDESGGAHAGGAVGSSAEVRLKSPSKTMNASASSRRALAPDSTVTPPGSVESQHGSLLAFGELLRHTGEFMLSRY